MWGNPQTTQDTMGVNTIRNDTSKNPQRRPNRFSNYNFTPGQGVPGACVVEVAYYAPFSLLFDTP